MNIDNIEMSLDIATAVSIIVTGLFYLYSQYKLRKQNIDFFIFENTKELIALVADANIQLGISYNNIGYSAGVGNEMSESDYLDLHKVFLELLMKIKTKHIILNEIVNKKKKNNLEIMLQPLENIKTMKPEQYLTEVPSELKNYLKKLAEEVRPKY